MAVDIPQQTSESKQNDEKAKGQADMQSKSGGQETVSNTEEYQRRWMQMQEKHQEQQKRLTQRNAIRNSNERRTEEVQATATKRKKKFMKGMGKYLIPSVATGGGIIGMLFGIN